MKMLRPTLQRYENFCCYLTTVFPKAFTSALYLYGIHGLLFECIPLIESTVRKWIVGGVGSWLFIQAMYTYFQVVNVGSGSPLDFPVLCSNEAEQDQEQEQEQEQGNGSRSYVDDLESQVNSPPLANLPPQFLVDHSVQVKSNGKMRYCNKCACWKPDRSHHCSSCNRCQLKMDHHCPWFAACVGFKNHKFFIQFLILSVLYTGFIAAISINKLYHFFASESYLDDFISINLLILCILSFTLSVSVGVFTILSLYLLLTNTTTIENYDNTRYRNNMKIIEDIHYRHSKQPSSSDWGNVYNLGYKRNWRVVMGESWLEWVVPMENKKVKSSNGGDDDWYKQSGLVFDTDPVVYAQLQKNSRLQNQLLEQLNGLQQR